MTKIKMFFLCLITIATVQGINSQLAAVATALPQIISLLENVTETPTSSILTQLVRAISSLDRMESLLTNISATLPLVLVQQRDIMNALTARVYPTDCSDISSSNYAINTGTYTITPSKNFGSFIVYCDMQTYGGGHWTVFQRRFNGAVDFYRGWKDYENGFGNPEGEHWAGLLLLRELTKIGTWELLIELEDFSGNTAYAHYASFKVGDEASNYRLSLGAYDGTAEDSFSSNNDAPFSTKDNDQEDTQPSEICAQRRKGAWWYRGCSWSNLNGLFLGPNQVTCTGLYWFNWKGSCEVLKKSSMKIRRIQ